MVTPSNGPTAPGSPSFLGVVVMVLVVIGLLTVAGWLFGAAWSLVRLGLLVAAVSAVVWAIKAVRT